MNSSDGKQKRFALRERGIIAALCLFLPAYPQQTSNDAGASNGMGTLNGKLVNTEADVFGRAPITHVEGVTNNGDAAALTRMLNNRGKNPALTFKPAHSMVTHSNGLPVAGVMPAWFIIDLKDEYDVSLIRAEFDNSIMVSFESDQTNANKVANFIKIDLSVSPNAASDPDSAEWVTVADKASLRSERKYIRYEFAARKARYVRLTFWQYSGKAQGKLWDWDANHFIDHGNITVKECTVCADTARTPKAQVSGGGSTPRPLANFGDLHRSQQIVIERGFPLLGWAPSDNYARGPLMKDAFEYSGPLFYDKSYIDEHGKAWIKNVDYLKYHPNAMWGIAKAPAGQNGAGGMTTYDFIHADLKPFVNNAVDFCFGDEGGWTAQEEAEFATWFAWSKAHYPGVLVHSNQCPGQWQEHNVKTYVQNAKPDMLTWDNYYPEISRDDGKQKDAVIHLLTTSSWNKQWLMYRELALKGVDETGTKPFIFGQYLDTYRQDQPESVKNLIANLSIVSGAKWLNFFRLDTQFDMGLLWDKNGNPTDHMKEWNAVIRSIRGIEKQILRLTNDYLAVKTGSLSSNAHQLAGEWTVSTFENAAAKNAEYHIETVDVTNISPAHGGGTGDVVLGYFKKLPGIDGNQITEHFAGVADPKCFMVLNGLIAGRAAEYENSFNYAAKEPGRCENTKQKIKLIFTDNHPAKLMRVNKANGTVEDITASLVRQSGKDTLEITLGGGLTELYFWKD